MTIDIMRSGSMCMSLQNITGSLSQKRLWFRYDGQVYMRIVHYSFNKQGEAINADKYYQEMTLFEKRVQ